MTERKPHILVATPCFNGLTTAYFTQSMVTLGNVLRSAGIDLAFTCMVNESLIQRARNALVHAFLQKPECTHLMFIDADIRFEPSDIVPMVQADREILCGIYPKKEINWATVEQAVQNGVLRSELKNHTAALVVNLADRQASVTVPVMEPLEIWAGGTGFMLIKREVFERLDPHVGSYLNDVAFMDGHVIKDRITEYFSVFVDPESGRLLSEDYAFCKIARRHGIKVWAAPWVRLGHFGNYLFEGGPTPNP